MPNDVWDVPENLLPTKLRKGKTLSLGPKDKKPIIEKGQGPQFDANGKFIPSKEVALPKRNTYTISIYFRGKQHGRK